MSSFGWFAWRRGDFDHAETRVRDLNRRSPWLAAVLALYPARPAAPVQLPPILSAVAVLHCNRELMQAAFVPSG
jgi:hypothetical protein